MSKITHSFIVEVYSHKYDAYVLWGNHYDNKEECLNHVKEHIETCLDIWNKGKDEKNEYILRLYKEYLKEYEDFTQHPITLIDTKYITKISTTTEQINLKENK